MKRTCMNKVVCLFAASASLAAFGLTDVYWVGGTSGNWNDTANWSSSDWVEPNKPNSTDCLVHITNEVPVTIAIPNSSSYTVGGIYFSGADHTIASGDAWSYLTFGMEAAGQTNFIDVAHDVTATIGNVQAAVDNGSDFVKKGAGTLEVVGRLCKGTQRFKSLEVAEGIFRYNDVNSKSFQVAGVCKVRSGAKFVTMNSNLVANGQIFHLDEGAIFDGNNRWSGLGGFTGSGVVTNLPSGTSLKYVSTLYAGPLDFAGRVHGYIVLAPSTDRVVGSEGYLRVGASDTLADATVTLAGDAAYTNVLRFAPGVGPFAIKSLDFGTRSDPIVLEDSEGEPITLTAGFANNYKNAAFVGCGNFIKSNGNKWIITNDIYSATGMLGVKAGNVEAGTGEEGFDATALSNISRLDVGSGATFTMKNYADTVWDALVTGVGRVSSAGSGAWTLNNLSLTNGTLGVAAPATNLVLVGGVSTNLTYTISPTPFKTTITGGDYAFSGTVDASGDRTFEQTGGSVRCCLYANGSSCLNDIFYTISGGRLVSYATSANQKGVGMDISGDAHVELRNSEAKYAHRLASGTASHTIRLSGNAYLGVDDLQIIGESDSTGTAVLDLQSGVMEVKGSFSQPSAAISAPAEGRILFNGGVLRAVGTGNQQWWTGANDPNELVKAYVSAAGATIDVQASALSRSVTVGWPFVSGVANGIDGGLVKLGMGKLVLAKPYAATGFVDVREGSVSAATSATVTDFGSAGVRIGSGHLEFTGGNPVSISATSGASLSFTNCATLRLSSGVDLTVGPSGAAVDSGIVREGHGVLMVMSGTAGEALGGSASVTVNGGLSNDPRTGILRQPVFERRTMSNYNIYRARLLKCAANNALVPATPVEFDPATSSASTVAQITGSKITVSANASVGALVVERSSDVGMTVNNGVTLSVGPNTAGSVAPILLNNVSLSGGSAAKTGIAGTGTIDFGASEGVIVVNGNATLSYPVSIETAIAGSGGVTFAAPTLFGDGIRGYIVLNKGGTGTYTGGTWIENVHVATTASGSLGTGTIHVSGGELEGGALEIAAKYDSNTFANEIEIAGNGPNYPASVILPGYYGALIVRKGGVTLSGGLTLAADAKIASGARGGQKPVVFSAPIVGPGKLTVSGMSPFRFAAANTYAGGTVIVNGTVEVTDAGTLGSGPVEVCAGGVLRFVNASAKTIDNVITGDGRIEMNGAAVTLRAADGFAGDIAGNVSGFGDDGYVKSGEGTVAFTNALFYTGATTVEAGTLRLGQVPLGVPAASESIAFHLDASKGDTIAEEDGAVVSWADADGRDIAFTSAVANGPSRVTDALNGMDALYFNGESGRRLVANAATPELRTVFFVNCVTNDTRPSGTSWSNMGIIGELDKDNGLRFKADKDKTKAEGILADSMFLDGVLRIDGVSSMNVATTYDWMAIPNNKFVITEAEVAIPVQNATFAIGDYKNGNSYFGDIAEVIAYDRWLTDEERIATERYLQNKWGLKAVAANDVFTNVLPVATALTVAEGATLDLAGGYQEVASLSGVGTIANSFETQATLVLSSGTSEFSGSFSGDIYLEVAEGATLDLCGGTITVVGVGGSGIISNGTVVVTGEIQPGGRGAVGTLTFETAPVVSGATLVVEGDGVAVDAVVIESAFDMTGLSLSVPAPRSVAPGDHAVVVSGVALSGEFYATDLPGNGKWRVDYTANAAVLSRLRPGALILVY